jgi:transketolase
MHFESGVGHIGGNLSCLDLLMDLYHLVLTSDDHFVLSKGHAAGAIYIALWSAGIIPEEQLSSFHREGTLLSGHPPAFGVPGVAFATGSLGHGVSLACGMALSNRWTGKTGRVFCLTSDGEWNEGSVWEALIFATHHKIENLVLIVDANGLQGFGKTCEVANLSPIADKFKAFGCNVVEIDGHADGSLLSAANVHCNGKPLVIVANTTKGRGVSFMENRMEWHYLPMTPTQYEQAIKELEK